MIKPTLPANETERLKALEAYQVLDTEAEKAFDAVRQQLPELISLSQSFEREMKARLFSQ